MNEVDAWKLILGSSLIGGLVSALITNVPKWWSDFRNGKATSLTVDTAILARANVAMLDEFQASYDYRMALGKEHGKKHGKFKDQALIIAAAKAAMLSNSAYSGGTAGKPAGFKGGSLQTIASAELQDRARSQR
jgi:hypothetical protein